MLDFTDSGFRPLRKAHSEPVSDLMDRLSLVSLPSGSSFVGSSGYLRTPHNLAARQRELLGGTVEKDPWAPLTKRSSFGHKAREEDRHPPSDTSPFKRLVKRKSMPRGGNPAVVVVDPFSSGAMLGEGVLFLLFFVVFVSVVVHCIPGSALWCTVVHCIALLNTQLTPSSPLVLLLLTHCTGSPHSPPLPSPFHHLTASGVVSRGYHCIRVLSEKNSPVASLVSDSVTLEYDATLQYDSSLDSSLSPSNPSVALDSLVRSISRLPWDVSAVIAGSETAVSLTDRLSKALGLKGNDPSTSRCRRDKHAMGEAVRSRGARAVRQILTSSWEEAAAFAKTWDTFGTPAFKCIVKPNQSAGSDDVFLCESLPDLKAGFDKINDSINAVGALNEGCLVQEFLEGTEYVVDSVSCNGVHKVTCVWEYDKRPVNGQFNVYFGMQPLPINTPSLRSLVDYAHTVLDAVGVSDGPSHAEVMMTSTGPCLVEVGARCHGGEGTWKPIADAAVGYNQMEATLDCYLDLEKFRRLPDVPESFKAHGREVFLVTRKAGVVRRLKGFDEIRKMPSYLSEEIMLTLPGFAPLTVDCFSRPASVQLLSLDPQTVEDDYRKIRELEVDGLYDYSIICGTKPSKGAVVVVDPFSSGAQLAARTISLGYHLILVFSTVDSPVASLVQSGTSLAGTVVQHDDALADADTALGNTLQQVNSIGVPVVAVVPGAETGVLLADELANRLGTRTNNIKLSDARRNKYKMAEVIRSKGLRAVKQTISSDWEQVEDWVDKEDPKPFKVIAKPNQSAGSDDVFCCEDKGELKKVSGFFGNIYC